jgi:hypothetical protein
MKLLIYVVLSTTFRLWYEKEKRRNLPTMLAERIDFDQLRVNVRSRHV